APPFKVVEFDIIYGKGISKAGELIDIGTKIGVIEKSGAWYSMGEQKLGQGKEATRQYLEEHPDVASKIEQLIRNNGDLVAETTGFDAGAADAC
ncbi:MAG: DNA recombination/repair protein RecA, partial [Mucispirillum sp.]|nr:DNA recombination/repair protein RecA [Mucispirillum sp.]